MTTRDIKVRMASKLKKITIKDIAKLSGYSIKTVSRVINNEVSVKAETREKIIKVMADNRFQANMFAKGLKGNKTNIIVVFVDRHDNEHLSMWHIILLKYLFNYAKVVGMKIVVSPSSSSSFSLDDTDAFNLITNGLANGVILLETIENDPRVKYFETTNIPYVVFGEPDDMTVPSVSLDNYLVGYKGGAYLIEKGYKNIMFFVGDTTFLSNKKRITGFKNALTEQNVNYKVYTHVNSMEIAYSTAKEIIGKDNIDAFYVSGDERAIGVYRAIHEAGLKIPEDIAVLGVDNLKVGEFLFPPISTIEQDFKEIAILCLDLIANQVKDEQYELTKKTYRLEPMVVERKST